MSIKNEDVFPQRPVADDWNRFWDHSTVRGDVWVSWSKRRVIAAIRPFLRRGLKILDAGCGSGFFSKYFFEQGLRAVACDYSDSALAITCAATGSKVDVVKLDLVSSQVAGMFEEKFDLIFSDGLLEHFSSGDQMLILENFKQLLSPCGIVMSFVPNRWSPWQLIRPFFMPGIHEKPFILDELVRLHSASGFRPVSSGGINVLPFRFSPDRTAGKYFGMLLYTIAKIND